MDKILILIRSPQVVHGLVRSLDRVHRFGAGMFESIGFGTLRPCLMGRLYGSLVGISKLQEWRMKVAVWNRCPENLPAGLAGV